MGISPELHSGFLRAAVILGLVFSGCILARNPRSTPARLHAIYGGVVAWWFFCMSVIASADTPEQVQLWARLIILGIGSLPGVSYHLHVSTAGLAHEHRRGIQVHYGLSAALVVFGLAWPDLLAEPGRFSWGFYPRYTLWALGLPLLVLMMFVGVTRVYGEVMQRSQAGSQIYERVRAFRNGNWIAMLAVVDFLPAFGVPVYPFGFVVLTGMHAGTLFGGARNRLIEVTPELAAERIVETIPDGLLVVDGQGLVRVANRAVARMLERPVAALIDHPLDTVISDASLREALRNPGADIHSPLEIGIDLESGKRIIVGLSGSELSDPSGRSIANVWLLHNLTDQRMTELEKERLEGWIRQTQKLETVGVMAGGIAHDFHNLLMSIMGSAELARSGVQPGAPAHDELGRIVTAVERAAELTNQLLTFSGRGASLRAPVDLNGSVRDTLELMQAGISKKAILELELEEPAPWATGDVGQIRQVILNLITNASEALNGAAGSITLRTGVVRPGWGLGKRLGEGRGSAPAGCVYLEVCDTGSGMDTATQEKIFDPFFTTKLDGRGLGLATVMGIVRGHGGWIDLESKPMAGTRLTVVLPAGEAQPSIASAPKPDVGELRHSGWALLADDEESVRRVARQVLVSRGFDVAEAGNGAEAVASFRARSGEVALVVLDVSMPVMTGTEAYHEIRALSPEVPVIFISGYGAPEEPSALADARATFLQKPFRLAAFVAAIDGAMGPGRLPPIGHPSSES